jgi:LPXTG-motif cell wall-anchored protein
VTVKTRSASVVLGLFAGLAGVFAAGSAASATASTPSATLTAISSCTTYAWKVTWKLTTTGTDGADGVFTNVTINTSEPPPPGGGIIGIHIDPPHLNTFTENGKVTGDGVFTEDQNLSQYARSPKVAFTVTWHVGQSTYTKNVQATGQQPAHCAWPTPTVTLLPMPRLTSPPPTPGGPGTALPGGPPTPGPTAYETAPNPPGKPVPTRTATGSTTTAPAPSLTTPAPVVVAAGTSGTGGGLPVTGVAAGIISAVAALLLAVGAVLFAVSRRRKVRFSA